MEMACNLDNAIELSALFPPDSTGHPGKSAPKIRPRFGSNALSHVKAMSSPCLSRAKVSHASRHDRRNLLARSAMAPPAVEELRKDSGAVGPVVVIDNYDSFTYNLCQYLGDLGCPYVVHRNDEITVEELRRLNPRGILISPGPGTPEDSGISLEVVRTLGPSVPLFGVCMGLQCMGQAFGGRIVRAPGGVMHGKTSEVFHQQGDGEGLLGGLPNPFVACRYHSLVIERESFPESQLEVTAWTADGLVMGVRHLQHRHIEGVQFHPESIITKNGKQIVANFVQTVQAYHGL